MVYEHFNLVGIRVVFIWIIRSESNCWMTKEVMIPAAMWQMLLKIASNRQTSAVVIIACTLYYVFLYIL